MKKVNMIFLSLLVIVFITGCGKTEVKEQTLVCTSMENDENMSVEQVISMTYKNDKLKHMTMEVNSKIIDSVIKENWEEFKTTMDKDNKEFNKDGVSLKVVKDDQNYEYNIVLNIDVENASEEMLEEQGFEDLKDDTSTLEENKELAEKDGATCVIK